MTLENLLRIGRIKEHPVDPAEIQKLLAADRGDAIRVISARAMTARERRAYED